MLGYISTISWGWSLSSRCSQGQEGEKPSISRESSQCARMQQPLKGQARKDCGWNECVAKQQRKKMGIQTIRSLKLQVEQAFGPPPRPWGRGLQPLQPARAVLGMGEPRPRDEGLAPSTSPSSHFQVTGKQRTGTGGQE